MGSRKYVFYVDCYYSSQPGFLYLLASIEFEGMSWLELQTKDGKEY
jgi:hypothetical protein